MESKTGNSLNNLVAVHLLCFLSLISASTCSFFKDPFPHEALPTKSGYLTVNKTSESAIFYTFYEAQKSASPLKQTPLLIWLQGGPGCSSMIGNFLELGPWRVVSSADNTTSIQPNPGSWNRIFGLLFLDNPIGTGFSIASSVEEIPRDQHSVARHLFTAITNFIQLEPVFKSRPIYITGESYAGKYVPSLGYYILKQNLKLPVSKRVNLAGVAIGDGLTDPVTQVASHAVNAYYMGLINEKQKSELEKAQSVAVRLTKLGKWREATQARSSALRLLQNMTGLATLYDYTKKTDYRTDLVTKFLSNSAVKKAMGADESVVFKHCSDIVENALDEDVMKSAKYKVEFLVKNTKVLLYQGQHDLRLGVVQSVVWVKTMKWDGTVHYLNAERKIWRVTGELAGYVQTWENLTSVVVLGAGHLLPADQAVNSQAMIEDWVIQRGVFNGLQSKTADEVSHVE